MCPAIPNDPVSFHTVGGGVPDAPRPRVPFPRAPFPFVILSCFSLSS